MAVLLGWWKCFFVFFFKFLKFLFSSSSDQHQHSVMRRLVDDDEKSLESNVGCRTATECQFSTQTIFHVSWWYLVSLSVFFGASFDLFGWFRGRVGLMKLQKFQQNCTAKSFNIDIHQSGWHQKRFSICSWSTHSSSSCRQLIRLGLQSSSLGACRERGWESTTESLNELSESFLFVWANCLSFREQIEWLCWILISFLYFFGFLRNSTKISP